MALPGLASVCVKHAHRQQNNRATCLARPRRSLVERLQRSYLAPVCSVSTSSYLTYPEILVTIK